MFLRVAFVSLTRRFSTSVHSRSLKRVVPYPPSHCFSVVANVENYQSFLPHCSSSAIVKKENEENNLIAEMEYNYGPIFEKFRSNFVISPQEMIKSRAENTSIFQVLDVQWTFAQGPSPRWSNVELSVNFSFRAPIYDAISATIMDTLLKDTLEAFISQFSLSFTGQHLAQPPSLDDIEYRESYLRTKEPKGRTAKKKKKEEATSELIHANGMDDGEWCDGEDDAEMIEMSTFAEYADEEVVDLEKDSSNNKSTAAAKKKSATTPKKTKKLTKKEEAAAAAAAAAAQAEEEGEAERALERECESAAFRIEKNASLDKDDLLAVVDANSERERVGRFNEEAENQRVLQEYDDAAAMKKKKKTTKKAKKDVDLLPEEETIAAVSEIVPHEEEESGKKETKKKKKAAEVAAE